MNIQPVHWQPVRFVSKLTMAAVAIGLCLSLTWATESKAQSSKAQSSKAQSSKAQSSNVQTSRDDATVKSFKPLFVAPAMPRSRAFAGPQAAMESVENTRSTPDRKVMVKVETSHGNMLWLLHRDKAPETVGNFLKYVRQGHYNETVFHRVIKGFMIQGGGRGLDMNTLDADDPIESESDNGLQNLRYTIAMARAADPDSATSQFFINTAAHNQNLDRATAEDGQGYTVFGEVIQGRTIVDLIELAETQAVLDPDFPAVAMRNVPLEPFIIRRIQLLGR